MIAYVCSLLDDMLDDDRNWVSCVSVALGSNQLEVSYVRAQGASVEPG